MPRIVTLHLLNEVQPFSETFLSPGSRRVEERILAKCGGPGCHKKMSTDQQKETSPMSKIKIFTLVIKIRQFARRVQYSMIVFTIMSICSSRVVAQDGRSHAEISQQQRVAGDQSSKAGDLISVSDHSSAKTKD
jgi:hypothetical protein